MRTSEARSHDDGRRELMAVRTGRRYLMADPTVDFFRELGRRGSDPMLARVTGVVRFDIISDERTDSWRVDINSGELEVAEPDAAPGGPGSGSPGSGDPDCVITAQKRLFEGIVGGTVNTMAALLRGELALSGDPELMVAVQRLFPGPPQRRKPEVSAATGGQSS
jgi:hypothetical protein